MKLILIAVLTVLTGCASSSPNPINASCFTGVGGGVWSWFTGSVAYKTITLPDGLDVSTLTSDGIVAIEKVLCVQSPEDIVGRLITVLEKDD